MILSSVWLLNFNLQTHSWALILLLSWLILVFGSTTMVARQLALLQKLFQICPSKQDNLKLKMSHFLTRLQHKMGIQLIAEAWFILSHQHSIFFQFLEQLWLWALKLVIHVHSKFFSQFHWPTTQLSFRILQASWWLFQTLMQLATFLMLLLARSLPHKQLSKLE